jgi:3-dehydrosphinganine reductase
MKFNFKNKNIIITGGSSGIGLALVKELYNLEANIWIIARDEEKILAVLRQINDENHRINYFLADVQNFSDIKILADELSQKNIIIDGLINSAGVTHPEEFESIQMDKIRWLMDVNYFGTVNCIKAFLPLMTSGSFIVNISSMAGVIGLYGYSAYGASKFAVRGFTDVLRSELKPKGIHVSIVFPPDTDTPQLAYENKFKPEITKIISGSATSVLSAQKVSNEIITGIKNRNYVIIPGAESKFLYHLSNLLGPMTYKIMDLMVSRAMRQTTHKKRSD